MGIINTNKIIVNLFEHNTQHVTCWRCLKCGNLFPLYYSYCPYCDPNKGRASLELTYEITSYYDTERNKEDNRYVDC
jgi:uncharacterized OB-fold protein